MIRPPKLEKECEFCLKPYRTRRKVQRFCSDKCSNACNAAKYKPESISQATRQANGLWAELRTAAYLVSGGYEVYWGFGNTSCDIVAIREGQCTRVEVKKASRGRPDAKWCISGCVRGKYDMLVVVLPDGELLVNPSKDLINGGPQDDLQESE